MSSTDDKTLKKSREVLLDQIEVMTEIPLMILSLVMVPLLLGPLLWDMSDYETKLFVIGDLTIWILFLIDMVVKVALSTNRLQYLKLHWLEIAVVVIPWFRPLRIVRLIGFSAKSYRGISRAGKPDFLLVYAVGLIIIGATLVTTFEQGQISSLLSFRQSLWWSLVTITTVGYSYGDTVPISVAGRIVAVFLMFGGLGIFGALTANLAAVFSKANDPNTQVILDLTEQIKDLKTTISSKTI